MSRLPDRGLSSTPGHGSQSRPDPGTEMIHLGPCPACGQQRTQAAVCVCSHLVMEHKFATGTKAGVRTSCSNYTCGCKSYEEAPRG